MNNLSKSIKAPSAASSAPAMGAYQVGDKDDRPWGHYVVTGSGITGDGEEYCKKLIVVKPGNILSLQSHDLRRETWNPKKGVLTALLDGKRIEVLAGESIHIPRGSIHCMANLGSDDCIVEERQEGICREGDIKRYVDAYNRATESHISPLVVQSIAVYNEILAAINQASATLARHGT